MDTIPFEELRRLITQGETVKAVVLLAEHQGAVKDNALRNEIMLLSSSCQDYLREMRIGKESADYLTRQKKRITYSLIELVDVLEQRAPKRIPRTLKTPHNGPLTVSCKTQKDAISPVFRAGESVRLFIKTSQACYLRIVYQLADKRRVLVEHNLEVKDRYVDDWVELGDGYTVEAPFGEETLYVFAQSTPFPPAFNKRTPDGYDLLVEDLPAGPSTMRGIKKKAPFATASLTLRTEQ